MKPRLLYHEVIRHAEHKNALVITGMRQVGKTTLLRQVFDSLSGKPRLWFDLDNPLDQKLFENIEYRNIEAELRRMAGVEANDRLFVFLDEIQNFPEVTKVIKYLIDHFGIKFFVTGSSNFYLKNLFPESLSGRKFLYDLQPMSFGEYLYFRGTLSMEEAIVTDTSSLLQPPAIFRFKEREVEYARYLEFGGFPEVVLTDDPATKRQVLKNIFSSFFEKDLRLLSDYTDTRELRDLILLLVPRVGSMLDVTKVASELSVSRAKIYAYLEFLQGVFFIRLLPKFSKSVDRRVAGGKKVYFADTGLLRVIGQVNDAQLFENSVVNQLAHYGDISFYSKRNTAEIDVVLEHTMAFEIKLKGTDSDQKKLARLAGVLSLSTSRVVSRDFTEGAQFLCGSDIL